MFRLRPSRLVLAAVCAVLLFAVDGLVTQTLVTDAHANRVKKARGGSGGVYRSGPNRAVQQRREDGTLRRPASVRPSQKGAAKALARGKRGVTGRRTKDGRLRVTEQRNGRTIAHHANGARTETGKGGTLHVSTSGAMSVRIRRPNGTLAAPKDVAAAQAEAVTRFVTGDPNTRVRATATGIRTTVTDGASKTIIYASGSQAITGPGGKLSIAADGTQKVQLRQSNGQLGRPMAVAAGEASDVEARVRGAFKPSDAAPRDSASEPGSARRRGVVGRARDAARRGRQAIERGVRGGVKRAREALSQRRTGKRSSENN